MAISAISNNNAYSGYAANLRARGENAGQTGAAALPEQEATALVADKAATPTTGNTGATNQSKKANGGKAELSPEELAQIAKLAARDREVRQHEAAHLAASGGLATSGASFTYQRGPDGVNYAIGGEVSIDTSPGRTPQETIQRAQTIQAAALAPADPSGADRAVAAAAQQLAAQARLEAAKEALTEKSAATASAQQIGVERSRAPVEPNNTGQPDAVSIAAAAKVAQAYVQPTSSANPSRAVNVFA